MAVSTGHAGLAPTVELLVSELATNAVRHGQGEVFSVEFHTSLLIAVSDASTHLPAATDAATGQESGRGLTILQHLVARWGTEVHSGGKRVWFQLDDT